MEFPVFPAVDVYLTIVVGLVVELQF